MVNVEFILESSKLEVEVSWNFWITYPSLFYFTQREPSASSTFVMLNSISDNAKREWWKQSRRRVRGVDKYKRNGVFKYSKEGKSKVER